MTEELNREALNSFITRLKDKDNSELDKIITRYISCQPEMVEAALQSCNRAIVQSGVL